MDQTTQNTTEEKKSNVLQFPNKKPIVQNLTTEQRLDLLTQGINEFINNSWKPATIQLSQQLSSVAERVTLLEGTIKALTAALNLHKILSNDQLLQAWDLYVRGPQIEALNNAILSLQGTMQGAQKVFNSAMLVHKLDKTHLQEHNEVPLHSAVTEVLEPKLPPDLPSPRSVA